MTKTWKEYWNAQIAQIEKGLLQWRETGFAKVKLQGLRNQTTRQDLYTCVTVTTHGAGIGGGQAHKLALAQTIAALLKKDESVKLCISGKGKQDDYLEFYPS
jgi:hypothetical protein